MTEELNIVTLSGSASSAGDFLGSRARTLHSGIYLSAENPVGRYEYVSLGSLIIHGNRDILGLWGKSAKKEELPYIDYNGTHEKGLELLIRKLRDQELGRHILQSIDRMPIESVTHSKLHEYLGRLRSMTRNVATWHTFSSLRFEKATAEDITAKCLAAKWPPDCGIHGKTVYLYGFMELWQGMPRNSRTILVKDLSPRFVLVTRSEFVPAIHTAILLGKPLLPEMFEFWTDIATRDVLKTPRIVRTTLNTCRERTRKFGIPEVCMESESIKTLLHPSLAEMSPKQMDKALKELAEEVVNELAEGVESPATETEF